MSDSAAEHEARYRRVDGCAAACRDVVENDPRGPARGRGMEAIHRERVGRAFTCESIVLALSKLGH